MAPIESESRFLWRFILDLVLTPITLIQVFFKRKEWKDLFKPFIDVFDFLFEAKLTITLILLNIVLYIVSLFFNDALLSSLINYPKDLLGPHAYTLITAGFLHASLSHLFGNMLALFIFGRVVERNIGSLKMGILYFCALILSGVFSSLIHLFLIVDNTGGLGASGAIMGLVASAVLLNPFYLTYELLIPLPVMIVGWLTIYLDVIGVLNPAEDGIGHFAHLGGFLSIAVIAYFMGIDNKEQLKKGFLINVVSLAVIVGAYYFFLR
ncbi:MAG: rhomboid family intramembrane serine protease [Nanoarchaeota archaeon]